MDNKKKGAGVANKKINLPKSQIIKKYWNFIKKKKEEKNEGERGGQGGGSSKARPSASLPGKQGGARQREGRQGGGDNEGKGLDKQLGSLAGHARICQSRSVQGGGAELD